MAQNNTTPLAPRIDKTLEIHNDVRIDPYFWMNERDSKPVLNYIEAENAYSSSFFEQHAQLTNQFLAEFEKRIDPNDVSAPFEMNGLNFQWRNEAGKDYKQLIQLLDGNKESVYFDENVQAENTTYYGLGDFALNESNTYFAFSEDRIGRRNYEIRVRDNRTQKLLKDHIKQTDGSIVWAIGNKKPAFFYLKKDPQTLREFQVYVHILGETQDKDQLVYEEKDERFSVSIENSFDKKYIFIRSQSSLTSEVWIIASDDVQSKPKCFLPRKTGHIYEVHHHNSGFFILTNQDAPDKKVLFSPEIPSDIKSCKTIVPLVENRLIEEFLVFENFMVLQYREVGTGSLNILQFTTNAWQTVNFPETVYEVGLYQNDNYHANQFNYFYTSMTTPSRIYSYDTNKKSSELKFEKKLIDPDFNPTNYISERVWATATDGTKIPVSLVYKKGLDMKNAPILVYGYGSYGYTIPCSFSAHRISLLDQGFIYAIAHIRGGKFMGEHWYQSGKMMSKRNTFTDFIACSSWLPENGYGKKGHVYAQGGSAGGLLMGAIANMAPQLFNGIIAQVPFVDVVTTMLDETIPLTVGEYEEWGNPKEKEAYTYMLSYSPYDQVSKQDYPAMYITTGYHDSQVQYWEPLKWVAKLRYFNTGKQPIYFECTMDAGHGGGSGISTERLEIAKEFTFLCLLEGIK